jgi:hypothetical protein
LVRQFLNSVICVLFEHGSAALSSNENLELSFYRPIHPPSRPLYWSSDPTTWTDEMDNALLAIRVEHHNNGDHAQNGWKPHVYNAAMKNVHESCNVKIIKET